MKSIMMFIGAGLIIISAFGCVSTAPPLKAARPELILSISTTDLKAAGDAAKTPCEQAKFYGQAMVRDPKLQEDPLFVEKVTEAVNKCMPVTSAKSN
jgi:hypothetical protein